MHLFLRGYKGERTVPLSFSSFYLRRYLDASPRLAREGVLFGLRREGLKMVVRRSAVRAQLGKRVYPYLFRHSRITELANRLTELQLKKFAGWEYDSAMVRNYTHLDVSDLDRVVPDRLRVSSLKAPID